MDSIHDLSSGKMCSVHSQATKEKTSDVSLKKSPKLQTKTYLFLNLKNGNRQEVSWEICTPFVGESWTLGILEYPREEKESSLSQILIPVVQEKYYLSGKACRGILQRAKSRNKELPEVLRLALEHQASA